MLTLEKVIERAKLVHGNKYDYSKAVFTKLIDKMEIVCPEHGSFWQSPHSHLKGCGCPQCAIKSRRALRTSSNEEFIEKANKVHNNKYSYLHVRYIGSMDKVLITCPIHGDFEQRPDLHLQGRGCPMCKGSKISETRKRNKQEKANYKFELFSFISGLVGKKEVIFNDSSVLSGDILDVYVPSKKIAFNLDDLQANNESNQPSIRYHLKKTEVCESLGIQLIHIFSDEWEQKQNICKSRIMSLLGCSKEKIYARQCNIVEVNTKAERSFLDKNHIQGYVSSKYTYGLEYNGELVSLMSFCSLRKNLGATSSDGTYELLRFCNKLNCNVIGGASRLFKHFVRTINPVRVISYADRRWSIGNLYERIGFSYAHSSNPNYFYVVDNSRKNRFGYRKDILMSKYGCKPEETEHEFCLSHNLYRIYDCGTKLYEWNNNLKIS